MSLFSWMRRAFRVGRIETEIQVSPSMRRGTVVSLFIFFMDMDVAYAMDAIVRAHIPDVVSYKKWIDQRYPVGRLVADFHPGQERLLLDGSLLATYASAGIPEETPISVISRGAQ